jgi:hypothetical protein
MRLLLTITFVVSGLALAGCSSSKPNFEGPFLDTCTGRITQNGKPVAVPQGKDIRLRVFHETGKSFLIPLDAEGKFDLRTMPIGKYTVMVEAEAPGKGPPMKHSVPDKLNVVEGKTEYTIELGPNVKL